MDKSGDRRHLCDVLSSIDCLYVLRNDLLNIYDFVLVLNRLMPSALDTSILGVINHKL